MSARKAVAQGNGVVSAPAKKRAPRKRKSPTANTKVEEVTHTPETKLIASLFARHETFIKQQETARTVFFKQLLADTLTFITENKGAPAVAATPAPQTAPEKATRKKKPPRDPDMPKRSMSSYMLFAQDFRKEVQKNQPSIKSQGQIAKLTSLAWKQIDAEKKEKYVNQATKLQEAYHKARGIYEKNKKLAMKKAAATSSDEDKETPAVATSSPAEAAKRAAAPKAAAAPEELEAKADSDSDSSDSESEDDTDSEKPVAKPVVVAEESDSDSDTSDEDEEPAPEPPKPAKKQKKSKKEKSRKETAPTPSKKKKKHKRSKVE